jgi:hypothetical protein
MSDVNPGSAVMIGSVAVEIVAEGRYLGAVRSRFGVTEPTAEEVEFRFVLGPDVPVPPEGDPGDGGDLLTCWTRADDHWVGVGDAVGHLSAGTVVIGGPAESEDDLAALDILCQSMVAVAFAGPRRVVVHGAAVGRGDDVMLVVGPSGAGKSTTAAAALVAGWELLSDDLVVVDLDPPRLTGIRRAPMFPDGLLVGSRFESSGRVVADDPRRRTRLPADVLVAETRALAGIVVVDHGTDEGGLEVLEPGNLEVISGALAVRPYAPFMRRQFAALVQVVSLPTFRLRHAEAEDRRLEMAAVRLGEALEMAIARRPGGSG